MNKPTMLIVLDGFGYAPSAAGNAVNLANMPFWRQLCSQYGGMLLQATGEAVGLLPGSIGNSEVGHMTLGAGRVVPSTLVHFDQLLEQEVIAKSPVLQRCLASLVLGSRVHLLGLLSDGGVHSHERHLYALLTILAAQTSAEIIIHPILDGRDVSPVSAEHYLRRLELFCKKLGRGSIASVQGRFYAMDRDYNTERTSVAVRLLLGNVPVLASTWQEVLHKSYNHGVTDEFIVPALFREDGGVRAGDGFIFFNTRPDRARQITDAILAGAPALAFFLTPIDFGPALSPLSGRPSTGSGGAEFSKLHHESAQSEPVERAMPAGSERADIYRTLFSQPPLDNTLLHVLAQQEKRVFVIAETEKYAHVTYFFQGMHEEVLPGQERVLVPSMKVKNYIAHPEMSAHLITSTLIKSLRSDPVFFYLVNFANADMVGHSGNLQATIKACEIIDQQLALLYHEVVVRTGGVLCITADHGNAESKIDTEGRILTAHTANPVPFVMVGRQFKVKQPGSGVFSQPPTAGLARVAPTLLELMGLVVPPEMERPIPI
ncbi:2,3-bisphosphoglycerate-independent phosphoglycerate mutase [Candidatus Dependentiae bacterium]|nr:2,3-bisphosphoglycerate-independent phosphoglycerate mutase [Candidatus Dependentiae bacterium]